MRSVVLGLILLLFASAGLCQTTNVTGTITDSGGQVWFHGTVQFFFVVSPINPQGPYFQNGVPFSTSQVPSGTMDGSGTFSVPVPDNLTITPSGSKWRVQVCPAASSACFSVTMTITGASQDVTSAVIPPGIKVDLANPPSSPTAYTDSEITGARQGSTYYNLTDQTLHICNYPVCTWASVSGGASAVGPQGTVQASNGAGGLQATGEVDDGTNFSVSRNQRNKGPNPWVDCSFYGCRSANSNVAPQIPGVTATCNATSSTALISVPSTFQNGDYVRIDGCGPTISLATPAAPTVTPALPIAATGVNRVVASPTGATNYTYSVFASTPLGGYTPASTATTIANGLSSLGSQNVNINTCARVGQTVTCSTTAPHNLAVGAVFFNTTMSVGNFGGVYSAATVPDNTHFTYTSGFDTNNNAPTSSTGGKLFWFQSNHVTWAHIAGAFVYYICRGSSVAGVSLPDDGTITDGALAWDDYGTTMSGNFTVPFYIPTSCPVAGQNDPLIAQVNAGASTTALTLSVAASNSVTNAQILFDNAPAIQAAATAAAGGTVYIPIGTYVTNSYLTIPANSSVCQTGTIVANATIQLGSSLKYRGDCVPRGGSAQQFAWQPNATIFSGRSNPTIYAPTPANSVTIGGITLQSSVTNNAVLAVIDKGFNQTFDHDTFQTGTSSADLMGRALILRAAEADASTDLNFSSLTALSGTNNTNGGNGSTLTPLITCMGCGITDLEDFSLNGRGFFFDAGAAGLGIGITGANRIQGGITPLFTTYFSSGAPSVSIDARGAVIQQDTMNLPMLANFSGQFTSLSVGSFQGPGTDGTSVPPLVSGGPLFLSGSVPTGYKFASSGLSGIGGFTSQEGTGQIGYKMAVPTAPGAVASAGGSVPTGQQCYAITVVDTNGNEGALGTSTCQTIIGGTQSVTVTAPTLPNGAVGWFPYRSNSPTTGFSRANISPCTTALAPAATFIDTFGFTCGISVPTTATAASASINSLGMNAPLFNVTVAGFKGAFSTPSLSANRNWVGPDGNASLMMSTGLITTAAASDNVAIQGMTGTGHCTLTPTNASAATDLGAGTVYISAKAANQITVTHSVTAGETFDISCSPN